MNQSDRHIDNAKVVLECGDLDATLKYFVDEAGFAIQSIYPADSPRVVELSGPGIELTLRGGDPAGTSDPGLIVTQINTEGFGAGRAGMQYRDLIPGRFGGRFIASHIRIPTGGPVPDYVHHHHIRFQFIFCVNGWVRVVYEDQGAPMLMKAGDCFLQPPHIRHRVLESSNNMEVVELACPAEHETFVDHDMTLPTGKHHPDRDFGGQTFVFHQADGAVWQRADVPGLEYRNTGIACATGGIVSVVVVRATGECGDVPLTHTAALRFCFLLNGSATLRNGSSVLLGCGDSIAVPPGMDCCLADLSPDIEMLEVVVPRQ